MKPTKADFDNAVAQSWHERKCLIAQMMIRHGITVDNEDSAIKFAKTHIGLGDLMGVFDCYFEHPGDEKQAKLVALHASLPDSD